jgi:hypothetical protein
VVRAWDAGLAASNGPVVVLCAGAAPSADVAAHLVAYADPRLGAWLGADCWSVRRTALEAAGGLDPWFGGGGWLAPADAAARIRRTGWGVRVEGAGLADPTDAIGWEQWTWNAARYARKRGGAGAVPRVARALATASRRALRLHRPDLLPELWDAAVAGWFGA